MNVAIKKNKGFTLLETLTSIAILSIVIVGPLAVIMNSSSYARQSKDTIVATYLAEESVELIQNQYDSLYILCKKNPTVPYCVTSSNETSGQISWRLFKERLGPVGGQPSCYSDDNPSGCSFDSVNMSNDPTVTPVRYAASASECPFLVEATTTVFVPHNQYSIIDGQISVNVVQTNETRHTYVCKGVTAHIPGTAGVKSYTRTVSVEKITSPFAGGELLNQDDLRITASVKFNTLNGASSTVKIVRFMHAQP